MILDLVGTFTVAVPPAARTLVVCSSVYSILKAAKQNTWIAQNLNGWWGVLFNLIFTALGLFVVVPANELYTSNTLIMVIVGVLGSSGIHGMIKSVPDNK